MSDTVIKVENLSKQYRLGTVGTGTLSHDLNRWWHRLQGKPDDPILPANHLLKSHAQIDKNCKIEGLPPIPVPVNPVDPVNRFQEIGNLRNIPEVPTPSIHYIPDDNLANL